MRLLAVFAASSVIAYGAHAGRSLRLTSGLHGPPSPHDRGGSAASRNYGAALEDAASELPRSSGNSSRGDWDIDAVNPRILESVHAFFANQSHTRGAVNVAVNGSRRHGSSLVAEIEEILKNHSAAIGPISLLVGDDQGIRYATTRQALSPYDATNTLPETSEVTKPFPVFSVGKWVVAAALGAAVRQNAFAWEDPVNKYIPWWTKDSADHRSAITFQHLMCMSSGLTTSRWFEEYDIGLWNESWTTERSAKEIYTQTGPLSIFYAPGGKFDYGESHVIVAQYAAMMATGAASWPAFFAQYLAAPLGLTPSLPRLPYVGQWLDLNTPTSYGFVTQNNPNGGADLIISPCALTHFLQAYVSHGDTMYGANFLDEDHTAKVGSSYSFQMLRARFYDVATGYGLGHWTTPEWSGGFSPGLAGSAAVVMDAPGGKRFWVNLGRFALGNSAPTFALLRDLTPALQRLMQAPPPVDWMVCVSPLGGEGAS